MNGEFLAALERIEREKGIDREILFAAIESALASAARKVIDDPAIAKEDVTVSINRETGEIIVSSQGEVIKSDRFGRIAAQTAKQVIIQKIREAERDVVHDKYLKKIGMIISGSVHRFEKGNVIVEFDDAEAVLPKQEQLPREKFRQGEIIRAYLLRVEKGTGGPAIVLSRSDAGFVKKLFELEVPEISQGIVEIKAIAREAGERTKIAVYSKDDKVDPVGACVGMRGSRVRDIVKELHGERIDIIKWEEDIRELVPATVNPAEVLKMVIDRTNKTITLTVPKDQLSLLIGKKGRNIRLASKLIGWELVAETQEEEILVAISDVEGIGEKTKKTLVEAGFDTVSKVLKVTADELSSLDGIGKKTVEKITAACQEALTEARKKQMENAAAQVKEEPVSEEEEKVEALATEDLGQKEETDIPAEEPAAGEEEKQEASDPDDSEKKEEADVPEGESTNEEADGNKE
ncbi:MAG: transcription termination factor NusA [Candidatus Omnitrophica bacterium]|nr:transcription termination factor NusA [Candidatus Omnitrophota bacterium]